ncbi:hypothetical protein [Hyperthermus butylicus]|uniref:Uncharacterized protein n=1 Tax=Hyperthermus butylicus (strain DSM 5456 / JCM 9403 / PLM1-5) TaxID=415426 RepID=A2BJE9_HYPBU|nr:hypothetical protein [Hyperthermus butylicus]ABM80110.1 hypothetical protein Hbut_0238 [Hyperthermus butylicus DSM 5456]
MTAITWLGELLGFDVDIRDPSSLLDIVKHVVPDIVGGLEIIAILAPYDSTEYELARFSSGLTVLLHSLVLLLSVLYASILHEAFVTGIYGVISAAEGSRTRVFTRILGSSLALFTPFIILASLPALVSPVMNGWLGYRGFTPMVIVWLSMFASLLVELLFYMALASIMAYYGYFIEYVVLAVMMLFVFPLVSVTVLSSVLGSEALVRIFFTVVVAIRPLHAAPGIVVEVVKNTSWDKVASPLVPSTVESILSVIGFCFSVLASTAMLLATYHLLKKQGVP